jgi:hypothetical protein
MAPRVKLVAVFLLALVVAPAVATACGSRGNSSSPCDVVSKMDSMEIQIIGPEVHGCDAAAHKTVSGLTILGLIGASPNFPPLQYGASAPTGTPVCTVASRDQTWDFYNHGGSDVASSVCKVLNEPAMLRVLGTFTGSAVHVESQ